MARGKHGSNEKCDTSGAACGGAACGVRHVGKAGAVRLEEPDIEIPETHTHQVDGGKTWEV